MPRVLLRRLVVALEAVILQHFDRLLLPHKGGIAKGCRICGKEQEQGSKEALEAEIAALHKKEAALSSPANPGASTATKPPAPR